MIAALLYRFSLPIAFCVKALTILRREVSEHFLLSTHYFSTYSFLPQKNIEWGVFNRHVEKLNRFSLEASNLNITFRIRGR